MDNDYFLKNWLETTSDFIFFKDEDGKYTQISDSILNLIEFDSKEDMIGKTDDEVYPKETAKNFREQDKMVFKSGINFVSEDWVNHKELGKILIETVKAPIYDRSGKIIGIQGTSRNITERHKLTQKIKERDSQLTAIFKTLPTMLWIKDLKGNYISTNKYYRDFFKVGEIDKSGEAVYEKIYSNDVANSETIAKLKKQDKEVLKTKKANSVVMLANDNGKARWVEIIKSPIILDDGTIFGILGIGHDVTERTEYENMMVKAKEKAEEASQSKSDFLANISHEIRTPMNGVLGFVQLLESTNLDDEQKDFVNEIKKSSKNMLELLNDLLDLAKVESGKMVLEQIPFNLRDIVDDVASLTVSSVNNKPVEVTSYIDSKIHENVIGDPLKLKQVLLNFTSNAAKFTSKGEIRLFAELVNQIGNETEVRFRVADTGVGIKKENLHKIFEAFEQEDSSTTRKYGGTGLGLTIAKNIVELMHGKVTVESTYGKGSCFSFNATFKIDETRPNPNYLGDLDLSDKVVLLYNENLFTLKCMTNYLQETKLKLLEFDSVENALDYIESGQKVDAIVTNYYNSEFDSLGLIEKSKHVIKEKGIPLFLNISRLQKQAIEDKLKDYNIQKCLIRPVRKRDYYTAIHECWGKKE